LLTQHTFAFPLARPVAALGRTLRPLGESGQGCDGGMREPCGPAV